MKRTSLMFFALFLIFLNGCVTTVGNISGDQFYLKNNFSVALLDNDWEIQRKEITRDFNTGRRYQNTVFAISFLHKKSSGFIGVHTFELSKIGKARSLEVLADEQAAEWESVKLSQKQIKIDGVEAFEIVMSGKKMVKYILLKKNETAYEIVYTNTSTYFDEYLPVFDKFVSTFKLL